MTWTSIKPVKPGFYWWRSKDWQICEELRHGPISCPGITIFKVIASSDGGLVCCDGVDWSGEEAWSDVSKMTGEWSSLPVEMPKERT